MKGGISYIAKRIVKQIIDAWKVMVVVKKVYLLFIWMRTIYVVGQ